MEGNDPDSDLLLPTRGEDDSFKFQRDSRQRKQSKGTTRWTLVGGIIGTLSVFSSLILVTLFLDSNTALLPISLDSPLRQYFNGPEEDPGQMALDGTWKEGFSPQTFNEFFENRMATCKSGKVRCRTNWNKLVRGMPRPSDLGYSLTSRRLARYFCLGGTLLGILEVQGKARISGQTRWWATSESLIVRANRGALTQLPTDGRHVGSRILDAYP